MKIGNIDFRHEPVFLAPMEDITDKPFRKICKRMGADLVYTEFVSSEALIREAHKSVIKLDIDDEERPVGIQIFGHDLNSMAKAAEYVQRAEPDFIDLNFGCPVKKVVRKGGGAAMLKSPNALVQMTEAVVKSVNLPVTVKTRLGWDSDSIIIEDLALRLQDVGISALTIHCRTRAQMYKGNADWSMIKVIKDNAVIEIPIIGNGDVVSGESARHFFDAYGSDAIMVGRAAIGNPWIFSEIKEYLQLGRSIERPSVNDRVSVCMDHLYQELENKPSKAALVEMRKQYSSYFKSIEGFKPFKLRLMSAVTLNEVEGIFNEILAFYQQ